MDCPVMRAGTGCAQASEDLPVKCGGLGEMECTLFPALPYRYFRCLLLPRFGGLPQMQQSMSQPNSMQVAQFPGRWHEKDAGKMLISCVSQAIEYTGV